ncbi:hypothetical protein MRX96_033233 [Rhipicephalus microplus]
MARSRAMCASESSARLFVRHQGDAEVLEAKRRQPQDVPEVAQRLVDAQGAHGVARGQDQILRALGKRQRGQLALLQKHRAVRPSRPFALGGRRAGDGAVTALRVHAHVVRLVARHRAVVVVFFVLGALVVALVPAGRRRLEVIVLVVPSSEHALNEGTHLLRLLAEASV